MGLKPFVALPAQQWRVGAGATTPITRATPQETAISVAYESEPYAVLMATPADIEDLAIGFTLSEGLARAGDILEVRIGEHPDGLTADVLLTRAGSLDSRARRRRNLEGRSSCGLCGVQTLEDAVRPLPRLADGLVVAHEAVHAALLAMEAQQSLQHATRAAHGAAWADPDGRIRLLREDVGRHNALDKVIGAAARAGLDPATAFIVATSRCSYEMVEKTAVAGVGLLATISAPTALAIGKAEGCNLTLIALARADGHAVFAGGQRLAD